MNSTLTLHCLQKIESLKIKNIYDVLPRNLYYVYVDYLCSKNFTTWKNKMKMVNLEAKLEDIEVEPDMYFDEPTYHIFVKNKVDEEEDEEQSSDVIMEKEFKLFHEYQSDPEIYDCYYHIVKERNMLDIDDYY